MWSSTLAQGGSLSGLRHLDVGDQYMTGGDDLAVRGLEVEAKLTGVILALISNLAAIAASRIEP